MRACIATGDYYRPGETFVNRHIEHLFGGHTCVVAGRLSGTPVIDKPLHVRRQRRPGARDLVTAPYWLLSNRLRYGTSRPPFGAAKAELAGFLRENRVQVILSEFGTQALAVSPLAREMGIPLFTYFRGTDASKSLQSEKICAAYRKMMPHLAGVFSVSQFLLDNLAAHDIHPPNAHVLPSGVNVDLFRPGEKRPGSFLAVGRFVEKKAPQITIRAFANATRDRPDTTLEILGDGPLLAECRALTRELGVAERVGLPGGVPHETVREKLTTAEVFLQHSLTARDGNTEGLPTSIQEALACGCPVIATRHAGIPEAVEPCRTGELVEEQDEAGFTAAIESILRSGRIYGMAREARAEAETRFDNGKLLARLEEIILETLGR